MKEHLRQVCKNSISGFGKDFKKLKDISIIESLLKVLDILNYDHLGSYFPLPDEIDWRQNQIIFSQENWCFPVVAENEMNFFKLINGNDAYSLNWSADNSFFEKTIIKPEVIVLPCLGHNARGFRLGRGGGNFDRYFQKHECLKVCLAYESCRVEFNEMAHDVKLDFVITEKKTYNFKRG